MGNPNIIDSNNLTLRDMRNAFGENQECLNVSEKVWTAILNAVNIVNQQSGGGAVVVNPMTSNLDAGFFEINNYQVDTQGGNYDDNTVPNIGFVRDNMLSNYFAYGSDDYFVEAGNQNYDINQTNISNFLLKLRFADFSGIVNVDSPNAFEGCRVTIALCSTSRANQGTITYTFGGYTRSILAGNDNRKNIAEYIYVQNCWIELYSVLKTTC